MAVLGDRLSPIPELTFGEGLMNPTLRSEKKITIRNYRPAAHDFTKGETVIGVFKDGLNILLRITADTEKKPFSELTDDEAREDGFKSAKNAFRGLKSYYPDLQKSDTAAIIRYEVLSVGRVPTVSINRFA